MKVLFDQGTPAPLRRALPGHEVSTAHEMGWATLTNGEFLGAAEKAGFDVVMTTDKNLRHQQNLARRRLSVLVLPTTDWGTIRHNESKIAAALESLRPGELRELTFDV